VKVGVIGAGTVGSTVAIKLYEQGYTIGTIASRTSSKAVQLAKSVHAEVTEPYRVIEESDLILLAPPDRVIAPLVRELAAYFRLGQVIVHFSGSLSSSVMAAARLQGAKVLSIHPLQSFASVEAALASLYGTHFAIEGDDLELGKRLVQDLGGIPHCFNAEYKSLYHAGACMASNYLVVLTHLAVKLLSNAGFEPGEALNCLIPLMKGTLANLEQVGLPAALTGPIARGDYPVVAEHLKKLPEDIGEAYSLLGVWAVEIAQAKGTLTPESKKEFQQILGGYKPPSRRVTGRRRVSSTR